MKTLVVILLLLTSMGCSRSTKQRIVVYSPHGKEMLAEFEKQYEQLHPDVDVQWLDMGSQDAFDRIRTERDNPQADVWWGAPASTFIKAEQEGLLEKYVPTWESAIGPEFKSQKGAWYGNFITPEVIMYNNRALTGSEVPVDWDELHDVKWREKIIIRYPLASGTMRTIFAALIQRESRKGGDIESGFEWLRRLDANTKSYVADPTQLYLKIAREEGLLTLWNLPDVLLQVKANGYPFGYVVPRSGTPLIVDCIAVVKGARNRMEAERFYEFVTSKAALVRQATEFGRIPARSDIAQSELPAWIAGLSLTPMDIDWDSLHANEQQWMKRWDEEVKGKGKK